MSRRPTLVAFAVISALLLVIAPGAQALNASAQSTSLVVGSSHSTASEFSAAERVNLDIVGSGESASVTLTNKHYNVLDSEGDGERDASRVFIGDTSDGSRLKAEVRTSANQNLTVSAVNVSITGTNNADYGPVVDVYAVQEAPDGSYGEGTLIRDGWQPEWSAGTKTISLDTPFGVEKGETWTLEFVTQNSDGDGSGDFLYLGVGAINPSGTWFWSNAQGSSAYAGDVTLSNSSRGPSTYVGPTHSVDNVEQAAIDIAALSNASAELTVEYYTGSTWQAAVTDTVTTPANHTVSIPDIDATQWRVIVETQATGANPQFTLDDESILFTNHKPQASNLAPADGAELTQESVEFSADISDAEFPTVQGDSVTAELVVDNQSVGSTTVTSNQTVTLTHNITEGGSHTYYWKLTDSYGATTTTAERTLSTPTELRVYNISAGQSNDLVDNATIEVRMYQDGTIYTRETSDGTVSLSGVSPTEPFVVVANAPGYYDRRIFVRSLYEQQNLYLLPDSETGVDTIFKLQEYTGQYQQDDTILEVERAINGTWTTALGDYFGANGQFPATLEYNTRYRLRITNIKTGDSRLLGTFTPISSGTQNVVVSPRGIINLSGIDATWEYLETTSLPAKSSVPFNASLDAGETNVTSWNISVVSTVNGTTTTLYSASSENVSGQSVSTTLNLSGMAGGDVNVVASYETPNGRVSETRAYTVYEVFENDNGLLVLLAQFVTQVPEDNRGEFTTFLAMMLTVLLTAGVLRSVPMTPEYAGIVAWLFVTAFGIIGWVSYEMVFIAGIGAVSFGYLGRAI